MSINPSAPREPLSAQMTTIRAVKLLGGVLEATDLLGLSKSRLSDAMSPTRDAPLSVQQATKVDAELVRRGLPPVFAEWFAQMAQMVTQQESVANVDVPEALFSASEAVTHAHRVYHRIIEDNVITPAESFEYGIAVDRIREEAAMTAAAVSLSARGGQA